MNQRGTRTDNEALVRGWVEALASGDVDLFDDLLTDNYTFHTSNPAAAPAPGPATVKKRVRTARAALSDLSVDVHDVVSARDKVVIRYTVRGTHKGSFLGVEATGKSIRYTAMIMFRVEGDRLAEEWGEWDALGALRQLRD